MRKNNMERFWNYEIHTLCRDFLVPYDVEGLALKTGRAAETGKKYSAAFRVIRDYCGK